MKTLRELDATNRYDTDKLGRDSPHDYTAAYEFHFGPYRDRPIVFWEIGVFRGGSLSMWADYFRHPAAVVVGFDTDLRQVRMQSNAPGVVLVEGDATKIDTIIPVLERHGPPDLVLDDGSHRASDMAAAFDLILPHVRGIYAVEDLGTQYVGKHGVRYLDGTPFTATVAEICDTLARNEPAPVRRVCWEPGMVFFYK